MNFFAKIFVVINLVLSIVFLGVAATLLSQKWDYKMKFETEKKKFDQTKQKDDIRIQNLDGQLETSRKDLDTKNARIREIESTLDDTKSSFQEQIKENERLNNQAAKLSDSFKNIERDIKEKDRRITELERQRDNESRKAEEALREKELAQDEQQRLEIQLNNTLGQLAEKDKSIASQQKELWEARQIIRVLQDSGVKIPLLVGARKAKPVDGVIQAVSIDVPLVIISVGRNEQVNKGDEFTVFRGSEYIGRVTVEEVYPDASAARIIRDLTKKKIEKGDSVTTRIGG